MITCVCVGHEVCKELRKTVPGSLVPIIMLSAKNSEDNIVEGLQNGCNDFVRYCCCCCCCVACKDPSRR